MRGVILLAALVCAVFASDAGAYTADQRAQMQSEVAAAMEQTGYPGMLVGVWTEGQGRFVATPGVADVAGGRPVEAGDPSRIGSVTKTFTATVILQLAEEGRLRLGDPVKTYLDRVPRGGKITIRMLLNHTSGIPSFPPGVENAAVEQPHRHWRPAQVAFRGLRQKRLSPPGAQWHYSNINYILLGEIAEELSDQSMASLFRDRVIGPLGLEHTTFRPNAALPPGALHGYFLESPAAAFLDTFGWNYSWLFTAGAMVSTLSDLHRYAPALATGEGLLSERMQRRRLRFVATGTGLEYGLGIFEIPLGVTQTQPYLGHNGIIFGYDSIVLYSPVTKTTIVIAGNTAVELDAFPDDQSRPTLIDLADVLASIVQGEPVPQAAGA